MASEVKLPELGEGIEGAQVLSILVSPGDTVRKDQAVIEVETEKATAEVPSDFAGVVEKILVNKGDTLTVGQVILTLDLTNSATTETPAPKTETKTPKPEPQAPVEPEPAPELIPVAPAIVESTAPSPAAAPPVGRSGGSAPAAPSVRRLARELGVPIDQVAGTGAGGRISESDVKAFIRTIINKSAGAAPGRAPEATPAGSPAHPPLPDFTQWGDIERMPLSMVRKATANAMRTAWATVPMVTQFDRADITALDAFRKDYSKKAESKITLTAIAVKVVASALKVFPQFNASLDLAHEEVIYKNYVHVGVAVDTDRGLLVPVLRDVDQKNIKHISDELNAAAQRARDRKTSLEELRGATFTISNLGGLGTTYFSPIVNWPELAILGMGRATIEAVFQDGQFVPRSLLPLAVTYDHRVIDGADAARFLRWIAQALEEPILLAVEG